MTSKEIMEILDDMHKEIELSSPELSTIILVHDHITGETHYYNSGFLEVQALMIKLLMEKDAALKATFINSMLYKPQAL